MSTRRALIFCAFGVCLIACVSTTWAQAPSGGRVIRDGAVIWRSDVSVPAATAPVGTVLDITAQSNRWYEVIVPASLGGRGERGLIARSQVQLLPGTPEPPMRTLRGDSVASAIPSPANAPSSRPQLGTFLVLSRAFQSGSNDFGEAVGFQENAEEGRFEAAYGVQSATGFSVAGGGMFTPTWGLGVALTRFAQTTPTVFSSAIPHPFFFDAPRSISANHDGIEREEIAAHVQFRAVSTFGARMQVAAFGGPTIFRVSQTVVTDFTYADAYPFDEAVLRSTETTPVQKSQLGFNVGGDIAYFVTRHVGAGFAVTFARARLELPIEEGRNADIRAGGLTSAAGLRLRF